MKLTRKQEQQFIKFYRELYGDTSLATGTGELPKIPAEDEEAHIKMWKDKLTKILGPRYAKAVYKVRPYGNQTYLDYIFSWLWLGYGPTILYNHKNENDSNKEVDVKADSVQEVGTTTE